MAGLSAAGAAAGTAIMPGVGTAVGGVIGALADTFMGGGGSAGGGYAPQDAKSAIYGDMGLDSSGWNVNFSGTQSNGSNKAAPAAMESLLGPGTTSVGGLSPLMLYGGLALIGLMLWKKSKSTK